MKPIRILHTDSSMELGGQEYATLALAEGLRKRGHDVQLAIRPHSQLVHMAQERQIPHHTLLMGKPLYPWSIMKLVAILNKYQIDIIHTHGSRDSWIGGVAARVSSQRPCMVLTRHKTAPIAKNFVNNLLYHSLVDTIVTTGGETARKGLIEAHGFHEAKVVAIPTGADPSKFSSKIDGGKFRKEIGAKKNEFLVGTVCFLRSYKGLEYFIDAAQIVLEQIPCCRFVIVGDGPEKERLLKKIIGMRLEKKIAMLGHRNDVPEIMAAFDVFAVSSTAGETLTQTIPQALAMEVPVVATNVGSISDIVCHRETGFLVPPDDAQALANQVIVALSNMEFSRETACRGRKLVADSFNSESTVEKNELVYRSLIVHQANRRISVD